MRIFFAGTPEIAVPSLERLALSFEICGVLTNPDRPKGRSGGVEPTPVKAKAAELGLKVFQPEKIDNDFCRTVEELSPDVLVTFAYGKIFRKDFLSIFRKEALNIHPSLLPEFRGASPIPAAILSGRAVTGITVQRMALKMDSGDIISQIRIPLDGSETTESLGRFVADKSSVLIEEVLRSVETGSYEVLPQNDTEATYCSIIDKKDGLIDWSEPTEVIERKVRGYYPWPGAYTYYNDKLLVITESMIYKENIPEDRGPFRIGEVAFTDKKVGIVVRTGDSFLALKRLKLQSKKEMDYKSFINGVRDFEGSILGE